VKKAERAQSETVEITLLWDIFTSQWQLLHTQSQTIDKTYSLVNVRKRLSTVTGKKIVLLACVKMLRHQILLSSHGLRIVV